MIEYKASSITQELPILKSLLALATIIDGWPPSLTTFDQLILHSQFTMIDDHIEY